jgi:hypothetical protein
MRYTAPSLQFAESSEPSGQPTVGFDDIRTGGEFRAQRYCTILLICADYRLASAARQAADSSGAGSF